MWPLINIAICVKEFLKLLFKPETRKNVLHLETEQPKDYLILIVHFQIL